jgi:hypothetical protein
MADPQMIEIPRVTCFEKSLSDSQRDFLGPPGETENRREQSVAPSLILAAADRLLLPCHCKIFPSASQS